MLEKKKKICGMSFFAMILDVVVLLKKLCFVDICMSVWLKTCKAECSNKITLRTLLSMTLYIQ
jgi:hypothetical protein